MEAFIWTAYAGCVAFNIFALSKVDPRSLAFIDGILIGLAYYIIIPMLFILSHGLTTMDDIGISYKPFVDTNTTFVIFSGMTLIPVLKLIDHYLRRPANESFDVRLVPVVTAIFMLTTIASFFMSGLNEGGHWAHNQADAYGDSSSFIYIKHLSNFARTAVFGLLLFAYFGGILRWRAVLAIGFGIVLIDLFLTFNRITAAYFLVMIAIMLRRHIWAIVLLVLSVVFGVSTVSNMWPMFRGLATQNGYSLSGMIEAAELSYQHDAAGVPLADSINGVFESSNLVVLNFVVQHGGAVIKVYPGDMIIRLFTFFVPKSIMPSRPGSVGVALGSAMSGAEGLSLNSTLFGEPYANFHALWILPMGIILLGFNSLFRVATANSRAMGFVAAFIAFAMWRFDIVFGVEALVIAAAISFGLHVTGGQKYRHMPSAMRFGRARRGA